MKIVTANLLADGRVAYLTPDSAWSIDIAEAKQFDGAEADAALADAQLRVREVADVYLIDAEDGAPAGRTALRETIRSAGPTIRDDLGKQAGNL